MWQYNYMSGNNDWLAHKGVKGMRWGYTDGKLNGKRTAGEDEADEESEGTVIIDEDYDGLFDYKQTRQRHSFYEGNHSLTTTTVVGKGKITKAVEAGQKFVSSIADKTVSGLSSLVDKGKSFISGLFKKKK